MIKLRNLFCFILTIVCFWYQISGTSFWSVCHGHNVMQGYVCLRAGLSASRKADIEPNRRLLHYHRLHIRRVCGTLLAHTQRHLVFNVACVFLHCVPKKVTPKFKSL